MKSIKKTCGSIAVIALLATSLVNVRAATFFENLQLVIDAVQTGTPIPADQTPFFGNFYSAQLGASWPPLPGNTMNLPCWPIDDSHFVYDDRNVDYATLQAEAEAAALLSAPLATPLSMMASSLLNSAIAYGNPIYFTNLVAIPASDSSGTMIVSAGVSGGTNFVPWDILMSTNVATPVPSWNWLGIAYTANNYVFSNQPVDQAFYMLAKPSKTMVVPWGNDTYGQCSDMPSGITNAIMVAAGDAYSLALLNNGTVVGWGNNNEDGWVPTNLANVAMVACGWIHNVVLFTNGTVTAWGADFPAYGYGGQTNVPAGLTNVTVISAQALNTLALCSDGTVVAWGSSSEGQTNVPTGLTNVSAIAAGGEHSLAVSNGFVVAWGGNLYGQTNVPPGLSNVWDVAAGWGHSVALKQDGTVVCWGDNRYGETNVPAGLSNVVAVAAGGFPDTAIAYTLALTSDGAVVAWGDSEVVAAMGGVSNVFAIAGGVDYALAIRTGPPTPVITFEPTDQYQLPGSNVTFTALGVGLYGVTYQWQFDGTNIYGATNTTLTVTNVQPAQSGGYAVVLSDNGGMGSIVSSNADLYLVTRPKISSQTPSTNQIAIYLTNEFTLSVGAIAPGEDDGFPLSYQWQFDGTNIGPHLSSYTFTAVNSGTYSVIVSNAAGSTNVSWQVTVLVPSNVAAWGDNEDGESTAPLAITNISAVAAGEYHSVAVEDNGNVVQWGYNWGNVPADLTNAVAVAAGYEHSIALRSDGTVETWGATNSWGNYVPIGLTGVKAVAAGWDDNVVLLTNGTVTAWGFDGEIYGWGDMTNVPAGLTNATAISAAALHALALTSNGMVVGWGDDRDGQSDVPAGLSNVVAVAAGEQHSLALRSNGTVAAWGDNTYGQCSVPVGLSNVMAIAAGAAHSVALKNDGTVFCWGDNSAGQTNTPTLNPVKLIAAGGDHTLAAIFSTYVQYPVDVTKDLLLIYNTNSLDSSNVCAYYLQKRPMVSGANVLGIGSPGIFVASGGLPGTYAVITNTMVFETVTYNGFTNLILAPLQTWLNYNPTKRPQYVILFLDVPSRVDDSATDAANYPFGYGGEAYPSVSYLLATALPSWSPFVTHINMNGTNDCVGYINKLAFMGTNNSPATLIISASARKYGNTNYYFDDTRYEYGSPSPSLGSDALSGVLSVDPSASVIYSNAVDNGLVDHITTGLNVAGYLCWGGHSSLGNTYATGTNVDLAGNSSWYLMDTIESFNGQRYRTEQGNFIQWFSGNAFGGANYSNTPIAAATSVDEPYRLGAVDPQVYFGLWEAGKNFGICAWNSRYVSPVQQNLQAIGDPFVCK